jgi:hypothetical protein
MAEDGAVSEYIINLAATTRSDGSVIVQSADLPLFSVVGDDEKAAYAIVMKLLPEYLRLNVPDFVDLRTVQSATTIFSKKEGQLLPASMIARTGDSQDGARSAPTAANP